MKKRSDDMTMEDLDASIEEITTDAYGDDEQTWAFHCAFEDGIELPCDAFVIGEPVSVVEFDYDGNQRRGLVARCKREDGSEHTVSASELTLAEQSKGGHLHAAYRKWSGLDPWPERGAALPPRQQRWHKVAATDLDLSGPIKLVVLSVKERAARCRLVGSDRAVTLRASQLGDIVPGEIAVVKPRKQWTYAGYPYLSGEIESSRLDIDALRLVPLKLEGRGLWTPEEHYWGETGEPIEEWAKPIIACGPRPSFEMEQVVPGRDPDDIDSDPICESNDLKDAGDPVAARQILMELCQADLRCLDAHAHLGNFVFDGWAREAIRHYEVGVRIGELSLGPDFDGLLPWGYIDNRPFLRCMHGFGLCLWRLERFEDAERVFERMLRLNPSDNQGVRFLIDDLRAGTVWKDRAAE
ncbi:MAG: tetratricopeptide repeat protein [Xanthomonadales bacterium]|nr:tetratricopeptide repeat protein [Xanthomonadales bacterium]